MAAEDNRVLAEKSAKAEKDSAGEARRARETAVAGEFASRAAFVQHDLPHESAILAIESLLRDPTLEADRTLRESLNSLPSRPLEVPLGGTVRSLRFLQGGRLLAAATGNSVVIVDALIGKELRRIDTGGTIRVVEGSPDGAIVAVAEAERIRLWDVSTGKLISTENSEGSRPVSGVTGMRFSPSGSRLAVADGNGAVYMFNGATGAYFGILQSAGPVTAFDFSPGGDELLVASLPPGPVPAGRLRIWVPESGLTHDIPEPPLFPLAVAWSPRGNWIAVRADDEFVRILSWPDGKWLRPLSHGGRVTAFTVSRDGHRIGVASADGTARIWRTGDWSELARITHDGVRSIAFVANDAEVVTDSFDGRVKLSEASAGRQISVLNDSGPVDLVEVSGTGRVALLKRGGGVRVSDMRGRGAPRFSVPTNPARSLSYTSDGSRIAISSLNPVELRDARTGVLVKELPFVSSGIGFGPKNGEAIDYSGTSLAIRNLIDGKESLRIDHDLNIVAAGLRPDGKILRVLSNGTVRQWRPGLRPQSFDTQPACSTQDPTGESVLSLEHIAAGWRVTCKVPSPREASPRLASAAFNQGASCLAETSSDGRIWMVDLAQRRETDVGRLPRVRTLAASADCSLVAAAADRTVAVWKTDGEQLVRVEASDPVLALAFSPDRRQLAIGMKSSLEVWYLETKDLIRSACSQVPVGRLTEDRWRFYSRDAYHDTCGAGLHVSHRGRDH